MSEAAAVATATPTASPSDAGGGAQLPTTSDVKADAAPQGQPKGDGARSRQPNGQFAAKEGEQQAPTDKPPVETEAQKESRRLKGKAKVFGQEEEYDYGEEDVPKLHSRVRMWEKKEADFRRERQEFHAERDEVVRLAKENPAEFLRRLGHDPQSLARQQLAEQARLGSMTEQERALHERDAKLAEYEAREKQAQEQEKSFRQRALREHINKQNQEKFIGVLEKTNLPKTALGMRTVLETVAAMEEDFGPDVGKFTPEELAQEVDRRVSDNFNRFLSDMDGAALRKRLGPQRIRAILDAEIADFEASQPTYEPPPAKEPEVVESQEKRRLTVDDVWDRLQNMKF